MATIRGTEGDDTLTGTRSGDRIWGFGGNDVIYADPTVLDFIGGNDTVYGGDGHDVIYAFGGRDTVYGESGNDQIFTADGNDVIYAGAGDDSDVQSGRGNDLVYGGDGNDALKGGEDDDTLYGEAGNDRIAGGSDDDLLVGDDGADELGGRTGNDTLDLSESFPSTDTVVFQAADVGNGVDTIVGFDTNAPGAGGDLIDAREIAGDIELADTADGDVEISVGTTLIARVEGVRAADILDDNILYGSTNALVAEADDGSAGSGSGGRTLSLNAESGPVLAFADVLDEHGEAEAIEAVSSVEVLDAGAALLAGSVNSAAAALGEAVATGTGLGLDELVANPDTVA